MSLGIELEFVDGSAHWFSLGPIKALKRLDEATGCGPEELLARLTGAGVLDFRPRWQDLREIVRCGLVGGAIERGQEPDELTIAALVQKYVDGRPRTASYLLCRAILIQYVVGSLEESKKKAEETGTVKAEDQRTGSPLNAGSAPVATSAGSTV